MYWKKPLKNIFYIILISLFASIYNCNAQCAMCKGTIESNQKEEVKKSLKKAKGLNTGILYLMILPYILGSVIAYMWYQNSKKEKVERAKIDKSLNKAFKL